MNFGGSLPDLIVKRFPDMQIFCSWPKVVEEGEGRNFVVGGLFKDP